MIDYPIPDIAVTETWTNADNENNFNIPGYDFTVRSRKQSTGGGVGLYVNNNVFLNLKRVTILILRSRKYMKVCLLN
jgi:hypothetical protein